MTLSVPTWALPLMLTIAIWAWAVLKPIAPAQGDYDFGPALVAGVRFFVCVIGTLLFWLVFFAAKSGGFA